MGPFVVPFAAYHERTRPKGWLEGLVKVYVGDGIAKDFYREMSAFVDEDTRSVMAHALDDEGQADFVVGVVRDTLTTDRTAGGRLALWGRRLLGDEVAQPPDDGLDRRGVLRRDRVPVPGELEVGQHPAHGVELGPRRAGPVGHRQATDEAVLLRAVRRRARGVRRRCRE